MGSLLWVEKETSLACGFAHAGLEGPNEGVDLKVLERAGLVSHSTRAQRRPRRLEAQPLAEATEWLERYRELWERNFLRLDDLLQELKATGRSTAKTPPRTKRKKRS